MEALNQARALLEARFPSLRFEGITGIHPGLESAEQGFHFFITVAQEQERRTGARMFVRSGAVGDDPLLFFERDAGKVVLENIQWDRHCAGCMLLGIDIRASHIHQNGLT